MKSLFILTTALLAGCAHTARLNPACPLSGGDGGHLISVEQRQSLTHLLVYSQKSRAGDLVALNPVGAPMFTGNLRDGGFAVSASPLYRGPEPTLVLWAFTLWRMRDQASACWVADDHTRLARAANGELTLLRGRRSLVHWSPTAPDTLALPTEGMTFKFHETN